MTIGASTGTVVAQTAAGRVAGTREGGLAVFRGVPYARPPVGALRFASPQPPQPWTGVREAVRFSPPFVQSGAPDAAEDALYANVWTPDPGGSRPVLVYVHGGAWQVGAGSVPTFDGAKLAERGDLVVVNFNYRLGAFGWGLHDDLADPGTGHIANWGLQDQIALVHWVRDNIAGFGGDPADLTLCGTSAGGASVWQLAHLPQTRDLVRRIIPISAAHPREPAMALTPDDARTIYDTLAARFSTDVPGLRTVPAAALHREWLEIFSGDPDGRLVGSGREYRGPVRDFGLITAYAAELPPPAVPVLAAYCGTEGSFFTDPLSPSYPPAPPAPADDAGLRAAVHAVLAKTAAKIPDDLAAACVDAYRAAARAEGLADDPRTLWTEVWGDALFRHRIVRLAQQHARTAGAGPLYLMEFAHPVRPPSYGTPHDATSKFLFGSHAAERNVQQFGDGPLERRISGVFIDLVSSFVHHGVPASQDAPAWPVLTRGTPSTLILGGPDVARVAATRKQAQLRFWDDYPAAA
jgi:para-nitrobenzyl esterase